MDLDANPSDPPPAAEPPPSDAPPATPVPIIPADAMQGLEHPLDTVPAAEPTELDPATQEQPQRPEEEPFPYRPWPLSPSLRQQRFQVILQRDVIDAIHRHGQSDLEREVCGVLVGNAWSDGSLSYLVIDAHIEGNHAASRNTQVTFTAETWTHVQAEMEGRFADRRIVGWYHTHPDFGVFLSDMDLFIHGNFFNLPWQVALVYDPVRGEDGLFVWEEGKVHRDLFLLDSSGSSPASSAGASVVAPAPAATAAAPPPSFQPPLQQPAVPAASIFSDVPVSDPTETAQQQEAASPGAAVAPNVRSSPGARRLRRLLTAALVFIASGAVYIAINGDSRDLVRQWLDSLQPKRSPPPTAPIQP